MLGLAALLTASMMPAPAIAQGAGAPSAPSAAAKTETAAARRGRLLYLQCRACHATQAGGAALTGPHLGGLIGRRVAGVDGFGYSQSLRAQTFVWDRERLDRWLEAPGKMVPGNTMAFAGMASADDRAALIDYLEAATASP